METATGQAVAPPPVRRAGLPLRVREIVCVFALCVADVGGVFAAVGLGLLERRVFDIFIDFPVLLVSWVEMASMMSIVVLGGFLLRGVWLRRETFWETVRLTVTTVLVSMVVGVTVLYMVRVSTLAPRSLAVLSSANLVVLLPMLHGIVLWVMHRAGLWDRRVLLVAAGPELESAAADLESDFAVGFRVAARREYRGPEQDVADAGEFDGVVVSGRGIPPGELAEFVSHVQHHTRRVTVMPDLGDLPFGWGSTRFLFEQRRILMTTRNLLLEPANLVIKRTFDLIVGLLVFIPAAPLLALLALAVKLDSRGPAFLRQERLGRGGRRFRCLKLRTMVVDAEERLAEVLRDPEAKREWDTYRKLKNDPRVTRVGRFLRATSLDELPQIVNVLVGDMSLVGPRPYLPREEEDMGGSGKHILRCRPGVTGLWQISGRTEVSFEGRLALESWYVRNWSLWVDITILLRTLPAVLGRRGAH